MQTQVIKHSIVVFGRKTSVSMERPFWNNLKRIVTVREITLSALIEEIDEQRRYRDHANDNLSSACRLYVLAYVEAERDGMRAGAILLPISPPLAIAAMTAATPP